jgi:predicted ATPase/DNA-binding XRE family transcriptional regulator
MRNPMGEADSRSSFGGLLRRYRMKAGFSQEELAIRANVSLAAVSALERGTRRAPQRQTLTLLLDGLGVAPAERDELFDAASRTRARTQTLQVEVPDPSAGASFQTSFPFYLTSFIARDTELADLDHLLIESRLITIVGAGGIGKTRLVCEFASRVSARFERVIFADLTPLIEGELVAPHIAVVLNVRESAGLDAIVDALVGTRALLVLDNCERVIEASANISKELLRRCPLLTILSTSRERLALAGEWLYRLQPLELPPKAAFDPHEVEAAPAVQLFIQRAAANATHFRFQTDELPDVAEICRRLDGIPLAIELAAARLPTLGIRQLRIRLDERVTSFGGFRDAPVRHQTMRSTIAWSFDLLDSQERVMIERIGIFVGGFSLDAAKSVCCDDAMDITLAIDVLARLVEKSLLLANHEGSESRYRLLEPLRLYSLDHLHESGAFDAIAHRHACWVAERADAADLETRQGFTHRSITMQMVPDIDNVRAALERLLKLGGLPNIALAARIVGGLRTLWTRLCLLDEAVRWTRDIFVHLPPDREPELSANLMRLQIQAVPQPPEREMIENADRIFRRVSDHYAIFNLYANLMLTAAQIGDFELAELARDKAERSLKDEVSFDPMFRAHFLSMQSFILAYQGSLDEARQIDNEATAMYVSQSSQFRSTHCRVRAIIEAFAGNYSAAIAIEREFLTLDGVSDRMIIEAYGSLAASLFLNGEIDEARFALRKCVSDTFVNEGRSFCESVQVGAAISAFDGDLRMAAHLKGFYDRNVSTRKWAFRNPLEIRLDETIAIAFSNRPDFHDREWLAASGRRMTVGETRALILSL